ncbi:DsbA family protein [Streptomyces edwardsiae]|uniref:Thioredoxin domain-containing protein n=1 Tax=Streptomyces edwardsiae TaxID=3075527 RepID=A0ABU2QJA1_9ACTN|nr:thioredoxin domain-containing protein [Streptomyces sp. DSM 41635]MDT0404544.1 thioredoxin domain-containing protein [Streptomyces sp. DSM 41635]
MTRGGRAAVLCAVAVLVLVGCGQRAGQTEYDGMADLPEKLGADGTTVHVGDPEARTVVHLYEDPRCPYCRDFEVDGGGPVLGEALLDREVRAQYTLASFLDDRVGGSGSKKAVNALRAALAEGKFVEYHEVLYVNQPEESVDGYTDDRLLELAGEVEGLRGPAFDKAVTTMKYRSFVTASEKAYERAGGAEEPEGPGTPTAVVNDKRIPLEYSGVLYEGEPFGRLLSEIDADPQGWEDFRF